MQKQTKLLFLGTFILLNVYQNIKPMQDAPQAGNRPGFIRRRFQDGAVAATEIVNEMARVRAERLKEEKEKRDEVKQNLYIKKVRLERKLKNESPYALPLSADRKDELQGKLNSVVSKITKINEEESQAQKSSEKWDNVMMEASLKGADLGAQFIIRQYEREENEQADLRKVVAAAGIQADIAEKGKLERQKEFFKPENLQKMALFSTVVTAGATGAYYGGKLGFNYLNSKIGTKPTLIRESSRHDWKYKMKQYWRTNILGIAPEEISLDEVILPQDMAFKMQMLADDTKSCVENGLPFRNVLFYGPPGTGKTMFAKRLAKYSDMDYAIMSGADFAQFQGGEGISELHKVFDWAKNSKKGLMIFIDEADSALGDRKTLDDIGRKIVNAFLSQTGESSFKFMIVLATNYDDDLDSAVLSRTHKKVCFDLPAFVERLKIFNLYFDKYIVNDVRKIKKDGTHLELSIEISPEINSEYIENIATKIDGFSGREIEQMASELRVAAYNIGNGILTKDIIDDVVDEKIKEHKHDVEIIEKQRNLFNAKFNKEIEIPTAA